MAKRKTRSQTRLEEAKRLRTDVKLAYKLPDLPLLSVLSNLDNDDLVSLATVDKAWHGRLDGLSLMNSAFWSRRVESETRDYWAQYGAVWAQLVKNVPLNLTRFGHALKLFRGIRDKTGVYDENPRDFEPDYWRLKMDNGRMMICSAYRYANSSHSPFLLRMYMDKICIKQTNGYCDKSMQMTCLINLRKLPSDEPVCFYQTRSMFITWPIQQDASKGNQQIVIRTAKMTYSIPSPITNRDVGHHLSCSMSRNGRLLSVVVQMPSITRVEHMGINYNRVHLYSLTDTGYEVLGVMRPERSLDEDQFHYQELDVQWRDNFLWVQTKFSRFCQIYAFPVDKQGKIRKQLLFEEKNCRVYELITFCDRFLILFDEEFDDHKKGRLCQFYFNLERYGRAAPVPGPIFATKSTRKHTRKIKELWSDTTKTFFLPFKIDLNHFVCAKHDRSAERLISDTSESATLDEPDSAVKAISLYELCFNSNSTITEYHPDQVKTPPWTNSIKNSTSRRRLSMIANSRNRVTSIKPSKVCWLKTASWDFMSPARRDLLKVAHMTGEWKRQRDAEDESIMARFKRRKLANKLTKAL